MSIKNIAQDLEKAIRNSEEYQTLKRLYDEVNLDKAARDLFDEFRDIQIQLQQKQMIGQEIQQSEIDQAQSLVSSVQKHEKISKLMEAEQKMSMIVQELNQIVLKPLEELYGSVNS